MLNLQGTTGRLHDTLVGATDGIAPIYGMFKTFHIWEKRELFDGLIGEDRFIPKLQDMAVTWSTGQFFKITDIIGGVPTLVPVTGLDNVVKSYHTPDLYRLYIHNLTTPPYRATVNNRLTVAGSDISYAVVYRARATEIDLTTDKVSVTLNSASVPIDEKIPMEKVANIANNVDKKEIYIVKPFHVTQDLPDGEVVTIVFYTGNGHVAEKRELITERSAMIQGTYSADKTVKGIELYSVSKPAAVTNNSILKEEGVAISTLSLRIKVTYADGSTANHSTNNANVSIIGIEQLKVLDKRSVIRVLATYKLDADEGATHAVSSPQALGLDSTDNYGDGRFVTREYKIILAEKNLKKAGSAFIHKYMKGGVEKLDTYYIDGEGKTIFKLNPAII